MAVVVEVRLVATAAPTSTLAEATATAAPHAAELLPEGWGLSPWDALSAGDPRGAAVFGTKADAA